MNKNDVKGAQLQDKRVEYSYTGFDEAGREVVAGRLTIHYRQSDSRSIKTTIDGEWDLASVVTAAGLGPQIGQGKLMGSVNKRNRVFIDLHPGYHDHNVILNGEFGDSPLGDFNGEWLYCAIAIMAHGTFRATSTD